MCPKIFETTKLCAEAHVATPRYGVVPYRDRRVPWLYAPTLEISHFLNVTEDKELSTQVFIFPKLTLNSKIVVFLSVAVE